jgi:hypothetical protein
MEIILIMHFFKQEELVKVHKEFATDQGEVLKAILEGK